MAQTGLYTYVGGYFIRNGNTWKEYRPADKDDVWATYTQYGEEDNYYKIQNEHCSLAIPKKSVNDIYIRKNNDWQVIYNSCQVFNEFIDNARCIYCYESGYFVRDGETWREYRPGKQSGVWNSYKQYSEDDNFFMIENSQCRVAIPKVKGNDFYLYSNNSWQKCYTGTDVYDAISGFDFTIYYGNYLINENDKDVNSRLSFDRKGNGELYIAGKTYSFTFSTLYTTVFENTDRKTGFKLELADGGEIFVWQEVLCRLDSSDGTKVAFLRKPISDVKVAEKVSKLIESQSYFKK